MSNPENWITFISEQWLWIVIAAVAILIVINVVKTLLKWVIVIAIVAGLLIYGANYTDAIGEVTSKIWDYTQDEVFERLSDQIDESDYYESDDGGFRIESRDIVLRGHPDSETVEISYKGQTITLKRNDVIDRYIAEVREN